MRPPRNCGDGDITAHEHAQLCLDDKAAAKRKRRKQMAHRENVFLIILRGTRATLIVPDTISAPRVSAFALLAGRSIIYL